MENFSNAKSAFPQWGEGKSTGPNSSQLTDGGAAVVLMRRSIADVWLFFFGVANKWVVNVMIGAWA